MGFLIPGSQVRVLPGVLMALADPGDFQNRRDFRVPVPSLAVAFLHLATYSAALYAAPVRGQHFGHRQRFRTYVLMFDITNFEVPTHVSFNPKARRNLGRELSQI